MKKVLALVLAVIMVCTMAMAVKVDVVNPDSSAPSANLSGKINTVAPGESIYFFRTELNLTDSTAYLDKDKNFVPDKNTVSVTFEKGADLIASQGWVKYNGEYVYALNTKASETAALDGTAEIIIKSIKVNVYGVTAPTLDAKYVGTAADKAVGYSVCGQAEMEKAAANNSFMEKHYMSFAELKADATQAVAYMCFDYGFTADKITISEKDAKSTYNTADRVVSVEKVKAADGKYYNTIDWSLTNTVGDGLAMGGFRTLKAGETLFFYKVTMPVTNSTADKALNKNLLNNEATVIGTLTGVVPNVSLQLVAEKAPEGAKMYMVNADGTVKDLGAKFDANGILVATAKVTGPVIVTDKALTATAAPAGSNTTNPGTGANDVVGVAAALAVVALVSGAAISLKK